MVGSVAGAIVSVLFEYDTAKLVHIRSKTVGAINRFIQLVIIAYIIGYVLVYKKGYQEFSTIESSVTTKLKGVAYTNVTEFDTPVTDPKVYNRLWDVADYVIPPQEHGAFFVMTNAIITPNQEQGTCPEAPLDEAVCTNETTKDVCIPGNSLPNGHGVMTGLCRNYSSSISTCEVIAWCPIENDKLPTKTPLLLESYNFTVLIKNSINFPLYKKAKTRNILATSNSTYLNKCQYDSTHNPSCPVFRLGTIIEEAKENYTELAASGGVVAIVINWECNLDFNVNDCIPTYSFRRLDDPEAQIAKGWNFRYANYFDSGKRTLTKAYGILFVTIVEGRGGRFNIIPLLMNVGAGVALLSVAVIICDIIVLYVMKRRELYRDKKFLLVDDAEFDQIQASTDIPLPPKGDSTSTPRY